MKPRLMATLATLMLLATVGLVVANRYGLFDSGPVSLPVVENCALHIESCSVEFPQGGRMTLDLNPSRPSPSDTLHLNASFEGMEPEVVGVRFKGVDMNMGYLENFVFELEKNNPPGAPVSFSGEAGVFACSRSLMQWLVLVRVQLGSIRYEVPFKFETRQPS